MANRQHAKARHAGVHGHRHHIGVGAARGGRLRAARALDERDAVAVAGRGLVVQGRGRLLHFPRQLVAQRGVAPGQHGLRLADIVAVIVARDSPDARRAASLNLILQTRPRTVAKERVGALAQAKNLMQLREHFAHRRGAGVGPVITVRARAAAAVKRKPRELGARVQADIRKTFVVAQRDVIARAFVFDEIVFQQQRFALGRGLLNFGAVNFRHHQPRLRVWIRSAKVTRDARLQVARFADIQRLAVQLVKHIHAGPRRQRRQKTRGVKSRFKGRVNCRVSRGRGGRRVRRRRIGVVMRSHTGYHNAQPS